MCIVKLKAIDSTSGFRNNNYSISFICTKSLHTNLQLLVFFIALTCLIVCPGVIKPDFTTLARVYLILNLKIHAFGIPPVVLLLSESSSQTALFRIRFSNYSMGPEN